MNNIPFRIGIDARLWNETGVGRYIRNLVDQLSYIDNTNQYYLYLRKNEFNNLKLPKVNFHKRLADIHWHTIKEQLFFPQILLRDQLNLMHFTYFSHPFFYNRPYVLTIHDLILNHFPTGKASSLPRWLYTTKFAGYKFLIQNGARNAKQILTVSNATKKEIIDHFHIRSEKISVTYEGVDKHFLIHSKIDSIIHPLIPEKYFLYVGNAYPHKNIDTLLNAFAKYQVKNKFVKLVIVGKKDFFYERVLQKSKELMIFDNVIFYTNLPDKELSFIYNRAIALVVPSFMEGFGLPALEAMSQKCLVIASAIPVFQEICTNAAMYFDPYNENDLLEKLIEATTKNDHITSLISNGIARVKQFSWERMAKETLQIYESCIRI